MKRAVIGRKKAGFAQFFRFRGDRSARRDDGEHKSVDKPTEEIRIIDEITRNRSGRRGASGDFPELEMKISFHLRLEKGRTAGHKDVLTGLLFQLGDIFLASVE